MTSTIILILAAQRDAANAAAEGFNPGGGDASFTVGLSANGQEPATHYWCAGRLDAQKIAAILAAAPDAVVESWEMDAEPAAPNDLLAQHGLTRIGGDFQP